MHQRPLIVDQQPGPAAPLAADAPLASPAGHDTASRTAAHTVVPWPALIDGLSFALLTVLVWGVNTLHRGLWQDDVVLLAEAFARSLRADYLHALLVR